MVKNKFLNRIRKNIRKHVRHFSSQGAKDQRWKLAKMFLNALEKSREKAPTISRTDEEIMEKVASEPSTIRQIEVGFTPDGDVVLPDDDDDDEAPPPLPPRDRPRDSFLDTIISAKEKLHPPKLKPYRPDDLPPPTEMTAPSFISFVPYKPGESTEDEPGDDFEDDATPLTMTDIDYVVSPSYSQPTQFSTGYENLIAPALSQGEQEQILKRRKAFEENDEDVDGWGLFKSRKRKRTGRSPKVVIGGKAIVLKKGSKQARDYMAYLRSLRKK